MMSSGRLAVGGQDPRRSGADPSEIHHPKARVDFPSTFWMRIEPVNDSGDPQSRAALSELREAYGKSVHAFIRRKENDPDRAADLTQEFFTLLIETDALMAVTERKGKFRSFLMAACTHFLSNHRDYERALKLGEGRSPISMDLLKGERFPRLEPFHELTPHRIFLRQWAITLIERVMSTLETEARQNGKARLFEHVNPALLGRELSPSYADLGRVLGVSETSIKVDVHRFRERYRLLLRTEIARTLDDPAEIDEELARLIAALVD